MRNGFTFLKTKIKDEYYQSSINQSLQKGIMYDILQKPATRELYIPKESESGYPIEWIFYWKEKLDRIENELLQFTWRTSNFRECRP